MKKTILITLLALLGMTQMVAQEYEYVPFVREGVKWVYSISDYHYFDDYLTNPARGDNMVYRTIEIKGDTIINGKTYKVVHKYSGDAINEENDTIPAYLREEDKMVYAIIPTHWYSYDDALVSNFKITTDEYYDLLESGQEFLLYDFQDPITYWGNLDEDGIFNLDLHEDTVVVGSHLAKRYLVKEGNWDYFQVVEGVGAMGANSYPLAFFIPKCTGIHCTHYFKIEKVVEDGEVIYPQNLVVDRYMPLIRENVKWVNERVTVIDGDTTCQYYTYEFKGNHPEKGNNGLTYKAMYSYTGRHHELDIAKDSLVAGLREDESCIDFNSNKPLDACTAQGRTMIGFFSLYWMAQDSNGCLKCKISYIIDQLEPFLNDENFVKAEPVLIDGYRCSRLAYIGEQGDTLAYVVEGIGFDSRDMGDLLTPFTRKPDPAADYQEWCGLSHVVKDGKIIYKGMRYRDGAFDTVDEVVADKSPHPQDENYYNLMGQPVGKDVPTTPGIYIHQGKKIIVNQ